MAVKPIALTPLAYYFNLCRSIIACCFTVRIVALDHGQRTRIAVPNQLNEGRVYKLV